MGYNANANKIEEKSEEHFLENYTSQTMSIRIMNDNRFESEDDEYHPNDEDKSKKLKFTVLSPSNSKSTDIENNENENGLIMADILKNFQYSATTTPTLYQTKRQFVDDLARFMKRKSVTDNIDTFYTKYKGKMMLSEKGYCFFVNFIRDFDEPNKHVQQFCAYRFYYRFHLFGTKISGLNINKAQSIDHMEICDRCILEDIERNFNFDNPCDCQCTLHTNCSLMNMTESNSEFCAFCIEYLPIAELKERRNVFEESGDFEVEK